MNSLLTYLLIYYPIGNWIHGT